MPKSEKKDKKKNKKATVDDQAEDLDGEAAPAPSKAPVEVTAEDLADEERGPVKGKKGKKGKGKEKQKGFNEKVRGALCPLKFH